MTQTIKAGLDFLISVVIVKYIIAHWIADRLMGVFKKLFITSERDIAIWLHYKNKALTKKRLK